MHTEDIDWCAPIGLGGENEALILKSIEKSELAFLKRHIELEKALAYKSCTFRINEEEYHFIIEPPESPNYGKIYFCCPESPKFFLVLGEDPQKWRFFPMPIFVETDSTTDYWQKEEIVKEMRRWPYGDSAPKDFSPIWINQIARDYIVLRIWFWFESLRDGPFKNQLRLCLHGDPFFSSVLPNFRLSKARLAFAQAVYHYSPLAKRATGELGLWHCLEYSWMLKHFDVDGRLGKAQNYKLIAENLKNLKRWVVTGDIHSQELPKLPETFNPNDRDWRLDLCDRIIEDAACQLWDDLDFISESEFESRKKTIIDYIDAIAHYNRITYRSSEHHYHRRNEHSVLVPTNNDGSHLRKTKSKKKSKNWKR